MTLEKFAQAHGLPQSWLDLRQQCENLVRHSDFWYRPELKDEARRLAVEASDLLTSARNQASERRKNHA